MICLSLDGVGQIQFKEFCARLNASACKCGARVSNSNQFNPAEFNQGISNREERIERRESSLKSMRPLRLIAIQWRQQLMLRITHTTPRRLLSHLRKLQQDGQALLDRPGLLAASEDFSWEVRVWRCLDKIAGRNAFEGALQRDEQDVGEIDLLDWSQRPRTCVEVDLLLRRRITRRLGTLASVIEKVEALAELPSRKSNRAR